MNASVQYPTDHPLHGMTQAKWGAMRLPERHAIRDLSGLCPQLRGLEGWRVEVVDHDGEKRRFLVGMSAGWRPCHLELPNIRSSFADPAWPSYRSVTPIRKQR